MKQKKSKQIHVVFSALAIMGYSVTSCTHTSGNIEATKYYGNRDSLIARGRYLVTILGCGDCHSPKTMTPDGLVVDTQTMLSGFPSTRAIPEFQKAFIQEGGVVVNSDLTAAMGPWGISFAANLTSDTTGIGNWTEAQFGSGLKHAKIKGLEMPQPMMPAMPWNNWGGIQEADVRAMFYYLQSTKPVNNTVPARIPALAR